MGKLKNKIIKVLGGYTKEEYEKICDIKVVKAFYRSDYYNDDVPDHFKDYVKVDLVHKLAEQMNNEDLIEFIYDDSKPFKMQAIVKVADPWRV